MLELHAIATKKTEESGEFAVAMTEREKLRFLSDLYLSAKEISVYTIWFDINAEMSDCSRSEDRKSIHDGIRDGCGFVRLNRDVVGVMDEWILGQLRLFAAHSLEANDEQAYVTFNLLHVAALFLLGKPADAIIDDLLNSVLVQKFLRRGKVKVDKETGESTVVVMHLACACVIPNTISPQIINL